MHAVSDEWPAARSPTMDIERGACITFIPVSATSCLKSLSETVWFVLGEVGRVKEGSEEEKSGRKTNFARESRMMT